MSGDVHARIREFWDADAHTYDVAKSHAISDPLEAAAWRRALEEALPRQGARVLDVGAGTGALSILAAELGNEVTALDLSPGMLGRAELKAKERGLDERMSFVVGSAMEPPKGPFDVVMERHVLWTMLDPVGGLARWREVARRLILFEGVWGERDLRRRAKDLAAETLRRLRGLPEDHHAPYPEDVLAELPLARLPSPVPLIEAVQQAGWSGVRIKRLRDVEWAAMLHEPWPLGWLERRPRYALVADA
jgi:SAM-dependent methyltransferase